MLPFLLAQNALEETNGDIDAAKKILYTKGLESLEKKQVPRLSDGFVHWTIQIHKRFLIFFLFCFVVWRHFRIGLLRKVALWFALRAIAAP